MTEQVYITITPETLLSKAGEMKAAGYALAQISATCKDGYDLLYSFEKDYAMTHLRLQITGSEELESISGIYSYAFLYENEMNDLFGLQIKHINIDFKGNLYKTAVKAPFGSGAATGKAAE